MKYEYNGHLSQEEKTKQVAKEIIEEYSKIPYETALKIASVEGKISTSPNFKIKFERLYNILLFTQYNKELYMKAYNDIKNLYYNDKDVNSFTEIEKYLMKEIELYTNNQRSTFPIVSEFYNS